MFRVQREIGTLKVKADEAAGQILNDDRITNFQKSIGWFKNEATKIDHIMETQKKDMHKYTNRKQNLGEDRKFLKDQVKEAMRHNKLMQIAVLKTKDVNSQLKEFLNKNPINKKFRPKKPRYEVKSGEFSPKPNQ